MIAKEKWAEAIKDFHEKKLPDIIERKVNIPVQMPLRRAISIIGPRRAGKTYTMFQIIKSLMKQNAKDRVLYLNLERTDLEGANSGDLHSLMDTYYEMHPKNKSKKVWLFLDEIQNAEKWEKFVRAVIDHENVQVFLSGSSSKFLSREIATSMRGRTLTYVILPFSFSEFLAAKKIRAEKYMSKSEKSILINSFNEYLKNGGYPEAVIYPQERDKILLDIVETTIYRDVLERNKIRNTKLLKILIRSLIGSVAKEFSIHKFYNFMKSTGMKVSKNTIYNYVEELNNVFFVFPLRKFSYSYRETEQSLPKIYLIDNGILTLNGINDYGKIMENFVFIELTRRMKNVYYYRSVDGKEVDFVILKNKKVVELIQVAYSMDDLSTRDREIKSLLKASKELRCKNLTIVTNDREGIETVKNNKIRIIPLWKWVLQE